MNNNRLQILNNARRVVIKAGSGVLTGRSGLNATTVKAISRGISALMDRGLEVIYVSSGAMAAGEKKLGLSMRPTALPQRQAVAATGQAGLMMEYEKAFGRFGRKVAQILLTSDDLTNRKRYLNARNTINTLLSWKVVPIINENDTVATEEIKLGDNDNLAAMITLLMDADILINLTDIDGLYDMDPRRDNTARRLDYVSTVSLKLEQAAGEIPGPLGRGGMLSKVKAAKKLMAAGVPMIIANGLNRNILFDLFEGIETGTFFEPKPHKMSCRKRWIAFSVKAKGEIMVDEGAAVAVTDRGKSLLSSGITAVKGDFDVGSPVTVKDRAGKVIATGLVNYSAKDIRSIMGLKSGQIENKLGYKHYDEIIHRNNLVLC